MYSVPFENNKYVYNSLKLYCFISERFPGILEFYLEVEIHLVLVNFMEEALI